MLSTKKPQHYLAITAALLLLLLAQPLFAHVKWFSDFTFLQPPLTTREIVTSTFIGLVALSVIVIVGMVFVDRRLDGVRWYSTMNKWLTAQKQHSVLIMRVAMAAVLLISWANDSILTPELASDWSGMVWLQFLAALLLLFPRTTPMAGVFCLLIYVGAMVEFGFFHMLDYLHYVGIGVFFLVSQSADNRIKEIGLPALYATIGFSLIWLGFEKLYYPSWSLYLLDQNPVLTLGFPPEFFLQGAAFIEISLGFLLLIGLLERPLAAIITLVFFMTTLVFGKVEVIGHTPLHAALIIFLFNGAGNFYKAPIAIHKKLNWRVAFAGVNFLIIVTLFAVGYSWTANRQYESALANAQSGEHGMAMIDLTDAAVVPEITTIEVLKENDTSYNLHVEIDNWVFTPELVGQDGVVNQGHAHVYIDGVKFGRLYSPWLHLGELQSGDHTIVITLNDNSHGDFIIDGETIGAETTITVDS